MANVMAQGTFDGTAEGMSSFEMAGERVVVHRAGDGPTVGYIHGMIGTPPGAPILAAAAGAGLGLTAPCLPGFTGSAPTADRRSIHDWVFHLSSLIDATGLSGQPAIASSVGAMVALELAAVRPDAFSHLYLVAPLGLWDDAEPIADPYATTLSAQRRLLTDDPTVTGIFFDDPADLVGDDLIEYGVARYETRTAAASLVWPIPDHGLSQRTHRIETPVTIIWGAEDRIAPPSYADRWAKVLPNVVAIHSIAEAGHLVDWDQPDAVAALVAAAVLEQK